MGLETKEKGTKEKGTKKKGSKKKRIFVEHKPVVVGSMIAAVAIAGMVGGIIWYIEAIQQGKMKDTLISSYDGLWFNDTLWEDWWGYGAALTAQMIINQIAEGLFQYEIIEDYTRIAPCLALNGTWSPDGLNFTCHLRRDAKFHDGTPFNATAVKWNFDRLQNLLNNMSYSGIWYDFEGNMILNRTEIIDTYIVKFVLNRPFIPFPSMLCSLQSSILSPRIAQLNDFIEVDTNLIGTGPFKYDSSTYLYEPIYMLYYTVNTTLLANPDYWGGPPKLNKLIFKYFENNTERYEKMIKGEIDLTYLYPWAPENYTDHPEITLNYIDTSMVNYVLIDNSLINATMRKALSYAVNYSKILDIERPRYEGGVIRARSPLSKGVLYSNWEDFELPYYNITIARQVLKDVNWNGTAGALTANDNITTGNEWENLVTAGNPLAIYNFTYVVTSWWHNAYKDLVTENFKQIGIELNPIPLATWWEYRISANSQFLIVGWYPDYNDPSSCINPMFSNKADGFENWGQVNDTLVQQWMDAALIEKNETTRERLFYNIQKRLIEEVYPCMWTYTERYCNIHGPNLRGINYNLWPYKESFKEAYFQLV